ncbi:beta-1-3-glucan-binding protein-like 3 [Homarus americanus]|uniref:Beta-1-3-glucan-binding protein-like 3 n=3 Tax=Homarus americanus TaxID=6706 RepID=A0A8J5TJB9_HOMAM|nr:beta-1-3-glucan-binding protein-like 3 [Homarus americanus]
MWAPDKRVLAHVHYSLDDTKSLAITVETPFQGWEKQDVTFTVSLKDYEITSRAAATWKNAEQMALTINGKFQPGLSNNALKTQILFSSSFENFERITFTVDHTMAGATINTNIVGLWNKNEMKGNFQLTPNETGVDARATFISPFTEEVLVTLHHELHDMALTTKLEAKYGAETSTITMKGHVDLGDVHDITLVVKAITPLAAFDANIKYTLNEDNIKIFAEGKVGEKQVLLNVNGEKTVTDGSTAVSGDLKFITPLTYPLTATFSHSHDGQQFTSQLEMTRIWSTFGTLKMHAEGHMISKNDIVFTAHITSPAIKASLSFTHKIEDKQMNSAVEVIVNGERINISVGGLLDTVNTLANLHAEVVSTFKGLNDIKVNIESMRTDSAWTSDVTFIKDTLSVHINHSIQYDDILNWENIFFINNMYKLRNKMSHVDTAYTHQLEYMWGAENVQVTATINPRISENSRQVDAQIILASSWTENMKVDLHHEDDGREYKPTLIIEYKPGSIIQLDTTIKIDSSFIYIESSLTTPFWQPLGYKLKVDFQPKQSITAVFIRGANKTKINAHGNWEEGKMGGHLQVHSTYLTQPIIVEASYDVISPEKMLHVAVTAHERYAITASFSGHMQEAKWSLDTEMPLELAHHVKFSGEYHIMTMPLSFNSVLQIDAKNYMVSCEIQEKQFVFDMDLEGKKGNLSGKWNYQGNHANVEIKFISPLTVIGDMNVDLMYDFQAEKRVIIKVNDGAAEVNFTGMLADPLAPKIILEITTPLEAFKTLGAEAQWNLKESVKTAEVKAHLNDNQYNWQLEAAAESLLKGYATSKITTTHTGWTALNLNGSFDFTAMPYKVAFVYDKEGVINTFQGQLSIDQNAVNGKIITPITGWEEIALSGDYTYENNHLIGNVELVQGTETYKVNTDILYNSQPKLKLNIKTPIAYVSNIELVLDSTIVDAERNIHMSFIRNDITYSVQLSTQFIHKTGFVKVMANSPIPGYTVVEINAKYDFTKDIKTAEMDLKIEGESRHFSVITQVNDNNVHLDIHTPFEGFETVKMVGDYTVVDGQHSVIATLTKVDQLFDFHFDFSVKTKVVSLKLSTPIAEIQDVQLTAKYDILDTGVDCLVDIKRNEDKIGLNLRAVFTPMKSIFHVAAETPVAGWNKLSLDINYDLISEKKTAEISVQKDTLINTIKGEGSYNLQSGSFKVETPIDGFEVIGAQYSLSLDDKLDASIKIIKNSEEWMFSAHGEYNEHNIKFELVTPFSILKLLSAAVSYNCTATNKDIKVNIAFNEHNYQLTGIVNLNPTKSDFTLTVTTPIPNYENISVMLKYDLDNKDELVAVHIAVGEHAYNLLMAGYIEEKLAYFKSELTSPFIGWTDVKFEAKADFTSEDKTLEISLEKDANVKAIAISGKLIGSTMDVNLKTPIVGLQNVRLFSSLDRTKRSLQFNMMSDAAEASLLTSFNSIKLHLRTPFERAEEISWQITKVNEGTYKAEWRRNDNFIIVSVEKQGRKNAFSVEVQSELQGWEFMALAGRLDEETLEGYVSGAVNEEKILVTGSGKIADVGKVNLHIETPSHQYRTLDVNFQYNINLMKANMELTSSSPNLHLSLRYNTVRNPQQGILLSSSGKITIVSPFVSIRNFHHEYHLQVGQVTTADSTMKLNEQEIFKLELKGDVSAKTAHLDIDAHTSDCHTSINYQLQELSSMTFMFRRQGVSTDKQLRIETSGTGNLPSQGTFDITIKNTFPHTPVTTNIHVDLDSASERKHMTIEVTLQPSKLYRFEIDYGYAAKMGDFNLRITTPDRMMSPWKRISGNFNMQNQDDSYLEINYGETTYTARGKLGIYDSDLMLNLAPTEEEVILQWRFSLEDNDYFLKMGRESKYAMLKLKGTYIDIANVNIEGGFKAGPLMENELLFTSKWNMANAGVFTAEGTFNYGQYHGQHHLEEFTRNAATRSATFAWTATSNISGFNSLSLSGNYDFNNKFVIYGLIRSEDQESKIDINLAELYPEYSHNTVELKFTALPRRYRSMQFTLSHDFRDTANKHVSAIAKLGNREYFVKANWNRSENFNVLNGNIDIQVHNVGNIQITMNFDVSNIDNAHAEVRYSRVSPTSQTNSLNMKWTRKTTSNHFESELALDSTFNMLSHARLYVNAEYSNDFQLSSGLEWNEKMITFIFDMNQDGVSTKLTTPFEHFESIDAKATYSLSGKTKKVTLQYERGNNKVDMSFTLKATTLKKGNLELILTTPFEVLKNLSINASWKNKSAKLDITRNGTEYNIINGTVDMKASKSSFDLAFTIPGWEAIRFAASYDVQDFLEGSTSNDKEIASLLIDFDGNTLNFNVHGYRNSERLYLELDGNTSFDKLKIFHFKMGSKLNTESFEGEFEVKLNEFEFKSNNLYEKRGSNGYYIKTMMESTLTPLPSLTIGIGRNGAERTVTVGYGEDREITFSVQGKNNYKSGFFGTFDIPNYGYEGVRYDVTYGFESDDQLQISFDVELGQNGEKIEAEFVYDSEGVKARLTSPFTGQHTMRVRRSVSEQSFSAFAGYNDYNLALRGGFKDEDTKRGAVLEGDIFGNKFLIDFLFQSEGMQYSEGKLIIHTPFRGMENMGGLFTLSNVDNKIMAHVEVLLPSYTTPKITGEVNLDLNEKLEGFVTLDVAGEKFILQSKLIGLSLSEGYEGTLQLTTPFHALPHLLLNVSIKMVDWSSLVAKFTVNENTIIAQYTMGESTFKFNLDTMVETVHRQLSLEAVYPSLENLEGVLIVVNGDEVHKLRGNFNIISNRVQGGMELESPLTTVTLKLNFDIAIPNASYDHIIFNVSLTTSETYSLFFELDTTTGVLVTVKIDTPVLPKLKATLQLAAAQAALKIETPQGVHEIHVTWRLTMDLPVDWLATLHLVSPLLTEEYAITLMLNGEKANMMLKGDLQVGGVKHAIEGKSVMTDTSGELSLNIETPYKSINRLALAASMSFGEKIEMHINGTQADNVNTLDVIFDTINKSFRAMVSSPLIPTGQVSIEALLTGNMGTKMKLKMALKYGDNTISGVLIVKLLSPENMSTILKITTPFKGYKQMNFVARYLKDEVTNIVLSLDKPLRINVELHLSNKHDTIMADMKIETAIENFEMIKAKVEIPLSVFAPSVLVNVDFDDTSFGANLGLRTKAPYELALGCHATDVFSGKFHLRMDSSFLSVLA